MPNLYQYLKETYKENEPIILTELQIEGMTGNNICQQLKKLTDAGTIKRFDTGIYYLPRKSIFKSGSMPSIEKVLEYKYLRDKDQLCGYISGLLFFNQMGLTTQIPMQYKIVSNKATSDYRETTLAKSRIVIRSPKVHVTKDNYNALQFLDMLKDVDVYSEISGKEFQERLFKYMRAVNLRISDLESYFSYYPDKLYRNLVEMKMIFNDIPNFINLCVF